MNIAVDLFAHGTLNSVPVDYNPDLALLMARRNEPVRSLFDRQARKTTYTANGRTFPRWVFNDVPVEPGEQYHFLVSAVQPGERFPSRFMSVWTHGADARTILPHPVPPLACVP